MAPAASGFNYSHPVLDGIKGEPTAMGVLNFRAQAHANAKAVETHLTDNERGTPTGGRRLKRY